MDDTRMNSDHYRELQARRRKSRIVLSVCLAILVVALPVSIIAGSVYAAVLSGIGLVVAGWKLSRIKR